MRFLLLILFGAGALFYYGCQEYRVSRGTSSKAEAVELSALESGTVPENNHLSVGAHFAVYGAAIYEYKSSGSSEPQATTKVNHTYYPIISADHPVMKAIDALTEKYGGLDKVPKDEPLPEFRDFAVLVKTKRFKTIGGIPKVMTAMPKVQGLVINRISSLDDKEARLLRRSFPKIDLSKVLILEDGRRPSSLAFSFGAMAGGVVIALISLVSLFRSRAGKPKAA